MLLSDDEEDGRFAGLLRQQERQLGHSAMTCLERTTLASCSPRGPRGHVVLSGRFHDLISQFSWPLFHAVIATHMQRVGESER